MKIILSIIFLMSLMLPSSLPTARPVDFRPLFTIYTASAKGTYYQIGSNIRRACPELNVQVIETDGSLDNLSELVQKPVLKAGNRFALVQSDVFKTLATKQQGLFDGIKVIMPLYQEDITVLVNPESGISTLRDLAGKKVSAGAIGSGVWFTATTIKSQLGIDWVKVDKTQEESMLMVLTGEIDALFIVGGHPLKILNELGPSMKSLVKIINISSTDLNEMYGTTRLAANTYPWQPEAVDLRSTKSLLVAAANVTPSATLALTSCITSNISELRSWGHPKWNEVKLSKAYDNVK